MTRRRTTVHAFAAALLLATLQACGGGPAPAPTAGDSRGWVPDLTGARVMVFPVQAASAMAGDPTAELAFALEGRAPGVEWILPAELRRAAAGSPGYDVALDGLPVGVFEQAEVRRIGDPLYGNIRRLAALVDAEVALIPVAVRYRTPTETPPGAEPPADTVPEPGRAEVNAALVAVVTGRVLWAGVVGGAPGPPDDPAVLASALDALGRALGPPSGR